MTCEKVSPITLKKFPPEILSAIFSKLTPYQVRRWVLPVCRQWNALGRSIMCEVVINKWDLGLSRRSQFKAIGLLRSGTDILQFHTFSGFWDSSWDEFLTAISEIPIEKRMRIKTVNILTREKFYQYLDRLLPVFSHVQILKFELHDGNTSFEIDVLFRQLPSLRKLQIVPSDHPYTNGRNVLHPNHFISFKDHDTPLPNLLLQSLDFWKSGIHFDDLMKILSKSPMLRELKLAEITKYTRSPELSIHATSRSFKEIYRDSPDIFKEISESCPKLQDLHLYSSGFFWDRSLFETFCATFPEKRSWSFVNTGTGGLIFNFLQEYLCHTITKLEILRSGTNASDSGLKNFLLVSTNLLYLDISGFIFEDDLIVLEDKLPLASCQLEPTHQLKNAPAVNRKIWACRKLQTLKMTYLQNLNSARPLYYFRGLLAYIVHVCPELENLSLRIDGRINFSFKSGICLLSKLNKLVSLDINSSGRYPKEHHLFWIDATSNYIRWKELSALRKGEWKLAMARLRSSAESRLDRKAFLSTAGHINKDLLDTNSRITYEIQKDSCLESNVDLLDRLRKSNERCWPRLEHMQFQQQDLPLVKKLRPELDYSKYGYYFYVSDVCNYDDFVLSLLNEALIPVM